jgi:chorismate dehydratase
MIYGLDHGDICHQIELITDYPAKIASMLISGTIDIGLVPVAVIDKVPHARVVTDVCIGCDGPVDSVAIFSEVPIGQIETVIMDYQSRTSVALAQLLMRDYWKKKVEWVAATGDDFRNHINGKVAAVVIGDRALEQKKNTAYMYDLGEAWKKHTGLPFVFACWVANKPIDPAFVGAFHAANLVGFAHLPEIIATESVPYADLMEYYTRYIQYDLDEAKRNGMSLFLEKLRTL